MLLAVEPDHLTFIEKYSGALTMLILGALVLGTLLILVPQLLRSHQRTLEMQHLEDMKALEQGLPVDRDDQRATAAGRIAMLVPIVVMCAAATVTCFLVAYQAEYMFSVSLAVWCVSGAVSLAAITGGVALMGRLAQLSSPEEAEEEEEIPSNPLKG
jgi:hypothetical protein